MAEKPEVIERKYVLSLPIMEGDVYLETEGVTTEKLDDKYLKGPNYSLNIGQTFYYLFEKIKTLETTVKDLETRLGKVEYQPGGVEFWQIFKEEKQDGVVLNP